MLIRYGLCLSLLIFVSVEDARADEATAEQIEHFEKEIVAILEANCLKCHAGAKPKGGLDSLTEKRQRRR